MGKESEVVILELTRDQAMMVEHACELMARLRIGQFKFITEVFVDMHDKKGVKDFWFRRDRANEALDLAAKLIGCVTLYNNTPDFENNILHHRAWSIYEVLRYTRSWHDNPDGNHFGVCYDVPMSWIDEPLPECRIVQKGD